MKQIYTTTLCLNLADEDDRRAFEHLRRMNKKQYRSYSKAIVAAINGYFEQQEHIANDPLETRGKEDAFLRRVMEAIEQGLRYMSCSQILNDYDGVQHDYTHKQGLVWQQIFLPEHTPQEWKERSVIWNAMKKNEKRKTAD